MSHSKETPALEGREDVRFRSCDSESAKRTPVEVVQRTISLAMQLKEFGRNEVDEAGEEYFVMDQIHIDEFEKATRHAAITVLEALAEYSFSADVFKGAASKNR